MLRPIESNLSLFNVEQKASQVKDPNAHQFQAMQQDEINKMAQTQAQSVQPAPKTDGDVKVRERKDDRDKDDRRKKKKLNSPEEAEDTEEQDGAQNTTGHGQGFDFIA